MKMRETLAAAANCRTVVRYSLMASRRPASCSVTTCLCAARTAMRGM